MKSGLGKYETTDVLLYKFSFNLFILIQILICNYGSDQCTNFSLFKLTMLSLVLLSDCGMLSIFKRCDRAGCD